MSSAVRRPQPETYVSNESEQGQLLDLVAALEVRGDDVVPDCAIVTGDGVRHSLTPKVADALVHVARALADGQGVTVVPRHRLLTTQEAAGLLNVSRPTLVKILDNGDLPYEMRGRHRRVHLDDLLAYQEFLREKRGTALRRMQHDAEDSDLYELLDRTPPPTR